MNSSRNRLFRNPNRQPKQPTTVAVYSKYRAGHRGSYIDFVCRLLDATQSSLRSLYHHKGPVLFLLIEDSFFHYISACLWRSIFGKRTLGLLMLPKQALDGTSLRHRVKRLILQLLKRLPNVKTITILPHDLDPRLSSISDDWIYDFQFWDLGPSEYANYTRRRSLTHEHALVDRIRESAGKRCVVSAVGSQVASKGFHLFVRAFCSNADIRASFLFAFGGNVIESAKQDAGDFERVGGIAIDRFLSDDELLSLYAASDVIWCHYSPLRDQSSGVFGRAIQLGLPVLVRTGSLIHRLCLSESIPHIARGSDYPLILEEADVPTVDAEITKDRVDKFRQITIERLRGALDEQFIIATPPN